MMGMADRVLFLSFHVQLMVFHLIFNFIEINFHLLVFFFQLRSCFFFMETVNLHCIFVYLGVKWKCHESFFLVR